MTKTILFISIATFLSKGDHLKQGLLGNEENCTSTHMLLTRLKMNILILV